MVRGAGRFDGEEFRSRRQAAGLSQQRVAEVVGSTRWQVSAYERGRATPEPARLAALAAAVSCAPAVLTGTPSAAGLAGLRRVAGMTRTLAVARLADVLGDRAPTSKWLLERAETGQVPAAWRSASRNADVVAAMAQAYGVPVDVVAQVWPSPVDVESTKLAAASPAAPAPGPATPEPAAAQPAEPSDTAAEPAARRSKAHAAWSALTDRQRAYLKAVFDDDQAAERDMKTGGRRAMSAPQIKADVWRWRDFAIANPAAGYTDIQFALRDAGVHNPGDDSCLAALERRGLLLVRHDHRHLPILGAVAVVQMRMTTTGRAAVRAGLGMSSPQEPVVTFAPLPDPGQATTLDALVERLRLLKVWAGAPSYESIKDRVNAVWARAGRPAGELAGKTTVVDCFRVGRRRLNTDLVVAVVQALHPDVGYVAQWRQALQVIGGESRAAAQVRVQDGLPQGLAGFTGRAIELNRLRRVLSDGQRDGGAVVISAIEGMAGVGKTQLAIHAGHLLNQERPFDRVLFVNLRGFHPDPTQPPADPAAVLDGFLRLLGVPGQKIPHDLEARTTLYRGLLAGTRALVILDNAADADQVRPLLPGTPGCPVLVTSRRNLSDLHPATHLAVDVFTPDEARQFLTRTAPQVPVGDDPDAPARIAGRCGHLPLALGLVAGHIRAKPGWTLTDHADWLDERHDGRRLDAGIELALDLSYHDLPAGRRRLLRLLALHPGQDLDAYAAAALADTDLPAARAHLHHLRADHLLQQGIPGRYTFHDLIRAYATDRAHDEDRPPDRRAALTRLFDHYLATTATAMNTLHPAEIHLRPRIPPVGTPTPTLTDTDTAVAWLDAERHTLVAVAVHTAAHGWPTHTTRLSRTLFRYLTGGHLTVALTVHGHAHHAARHSGDPIGQAHALTDLGVAHRRLGRPGPAAEHFQQALELFRQAGDPAGEARTLNNLGILAERSGHYRTATDHFAQALTLHRQTGNRTSEARALSNLGEVEGRLGRYRPAADHYARAMILLRQAGDRTGEANALNGLGDVEVRSGRYEPAGDHLQQALTLFRQLGNRTGEASVLDGLGLLHTRLGQPARATEHHQQALTICRETGYREGEVWALNGLGEAAHTAGRPADALSHHTAAHTIAADSDQQARAHTGLGHAHHTLGHPALAREHYQHAVTLYTDLGMPEADEIRTHLTTLDIPGPNSDS
jgi:tetratricopeptide (TPR) repeat protein